MAHRSPRIHQVLATLGYGDAIGHEVLGIQRVLRGAGFDVGHLRRDGRPAAGVADARLPRPDRRERPRRPPDPPLLDRVARLARGLRGARSDGARLPQHHAARVLRRRARAAGGAVLQGPARAARVPAACGPGARRLGVQPPGARGARVPADRRPAGRRRTSRTSTGEPNRLMAGQLRRRLDEHPVCRPRHSQQADRGRDPRVPRLQARVQPAVAAARRRLVRRVRALPGDAPAAGGDAAARRTCTSRASAPTRSSRPTTTSPTCSSAPASTRASASRSSRRSTSRSRSWPTPRPRCRPRWTGRASCTARTDPLHVASLMDAVLSDRACATRSSPDRTRRWRGCGRRTSAARCSGSSSRCSPRRGAAPTRWPWTSGTSSDDGGTRRAAPVPAGGLSGPPGGPRARAARRAQARARADGARVQP